MIIEQVDENKIKVIVNTEEQKEFGVTYESMNYSDANTRKLCERIMNKAGREIGFKIGSSKLLVEARQSYNGNVTLYLSKISAQKEQERLFEGNICFSDANALMDACKLFYTYVETLKDSSLYYYKNKYYLFFEVLQTRTGAESLWRTLLEFGDKISVSRAFIKEHGECICKEDIILKMLGLSHMYNYLEY